MTRVLHPTDGLARPEFAIGVPDQVVFLGRLVPREVMAQITGGCPEPTLDREDENPSPLRIGELSFAATTSG